MPSNDLGGERSAATAGAGCVGIAEFKSAPVESADKVDRCAF